MTGWATIKKIRAFEERAARLGFKVEEPTQYNQSYRSNNFAVGTGSSIWIDEMSSDSISLTPADDRYPCWSRNSSIFSGSIEEGNIFLQGVEFAHISDANIGLGAEKKRAMFERKYIERQRRLEEARKKKAEQKKVWDILQHGRVMDKDEEVPF